MIRRRGIDSVEYLRKQGMMMNIWHVLKKLIMLSNTRKSNYNCFKANEFLRIFSQNSALTPSIGNTAHNS